MRTSPLPALPSAHALLSLSLLSPTLALPVVTRGPSLFPLWPWPWASLITYLSSSLPVSLSTCLACSGCTSFQLCCSS